MSGSEVFQWQCAVLIYFFKGSLDTVKPLVNVLEEILRGNASLRHSSRCPSPEDSYWPISPPPPRTHIHLFSGDHAQWPYKQRSLSENISHTVNSISREIIILTPIHVRTAQWYQHSASQTPACLWITWVKCRFRFNSSGVQPNTCVSNKLHWTLILLVCKPHLSSKVLVSLPSPIWSTFYLQVSLWLVIYQETYTGQKTQNLCIGGSLSCTQVLTGAHCPGAGSFFLPRWICLFLLA